MLPKDTVRGARRRVTIGGMRASVIRAFGPPEVLTLEEVEGVSPGEGQVAIDVELANITFVETQVRAGKAPRPEMLPKLPAILGNGVAGRTDGGRRVISSLNGSGGYASRAVASAEAVIDIPDGLAMTEALALLADGRTAVMLIGSAAISPGETVLVEAAAGGVGSLLVQLAHASGAQVLGAAGGGRKLDVVRLLGADRVVDYSRADWTEQVPEGVDVVFDGVGGSTGDAAFALLRRGGRFCPFGMASGAFSAVDENAAAARGVTLVRGLRASPEEIRSAALSALRHAEEGRLKPLIGQTFPLRDAASAHRAIESRLTVGKTLLVVN